MPLKWYRVPTEMDIQARLKGTAIPWLVLLLVPLLAAGKGPPGVSAVYDDWKIVELRHGDLEVCYAETALIPSPTIGPEFHDLNLQVTAHSFSSSRPMIYYSTSMQNKRQYTFRLLADPAEEELYTPGNFRQLEAESERLSLQLLARRGSYRGVAGTFSLAGYSAAIDAIEKSCGSHVTGGGRAIASESAAVKVSPVSVNSRHSVDFSVEGPFFRAGESETLRIQSVPEFDDVWEWPEFNLYREQGSPRMVVRFSSGRLDFFRNETRIHTDPYRGDVMEMGACIDPRRQTLKLILHRWLGGAPDPGTWYGLSFDDEWKSPHRLLSEAESSQYWKDCSAEGVSIWEWASEFRPCLCTGRMSSENQAYYAALEAWKSDVEGAGRRAGLKVEDSPRIDNAVISSLVDRAAAMDPFTRWDEDSYIEYERFRSRLFEVLVLEYTSATLLYDSFQFIFARRIGQESWKALHEAPMSRATVLQATVHGFVDDANLDIEYFFEACGTTDCRERVQWNLAEIL